MFLFGHWESWLSQRRGKAHDSSAKFAICAAYVRCTIENAVVQENRIIQVVSSGGDEWFSAERLKNLEYEGEILATLIHDYASYCTDLLSELI